jgi:hypothetical protein
MSKAAKDLMNAIKNMASNVDLITASVVSVDKSNNCCDVSIDGDELGSVRLQAVIDVDKKGCRMYPAINSTVLIQPMDDKGNWVVALYSELQEIVFEIGDMQMVMNAEGVFFNGGSLGGLVKVGSLVARLNALEDDLTSLKTVFNSWIVVPTDGGAALKTAAASWFGTPITKTKTSDLEDNKIKH